MLSPNDVRLEEGWPASDDPTADSIEPPAAGGKPASDAADGPPEPALAPADDGEKAGRIARIGEHRHRGMFNAGD